MEALEASKVAHQAILSMDVKSVSKGGLKLHRISREKVEVLDWKSLKIGERTTENDKVEKREPFIGAEGPERSPRLGLRDSKSWKCPHGSSRVFLENRTF